MYNKILLTTLDLDSPKSIMLKNKHTPILGVVGCDAKPQNFEGLMKEKPKQSYRGD